jgi:hypothetical protein
MDLDPSRASASRSRSHANGKVTEGMLAAARAVAMEAVEGAMLSHTHVLQRIETKVDGLKTSVGAATLDERGKPVGTGMAGQLQRLEHRVEGRFREFDNWKTFGKGAIAAAVLFGAVIWWLVSGRIDFLR